MKIEFQGKKKHTKIKSFGNFRLQEFKFTLKQLFNP